jgi:hypothetical protein
MTSLESREISARRSPVPDYEQTGSNRITSRLPTIRKQSKELTLNQTAKVFSLVFWNVAVWVTIPTSARCVQVRRVGVVVVDPGQPF